MSPVTYQEIKDRADKVNLGRVCEDVFNELKRTMWGPCTRAGACEVFESWWTNNKAKPDIEEHRPAYIMLYHFRARLLEKERKARRGK